MQGAYQKSCIAYWNTKRNKGQIPICLGREQFFSSSFQLSEKPPNGSGRDQGLSLPDTAGKTIAVRSNRSKTEGKKFYYSHKTN